MRHFEVCIPWGTTCRSLGVKTCQGGVHNRSQKRRLEKRAATGRSRSWAGVRHETSMSEVHVMVSLLAMIEAGSSLESTHWSALMFSMCVLRRPVCIKESRLIYEQGVGGNEDGAKKGKITTMLHRQEPRVSGWSSLLRNGRRPAVTSPCPHVPYPRTSART